MWILKLLIHFQMKYWFHSQREWEETTTNADQLKREKVIGYDAKDVNLSFNWSDLTNDFLILIFHSRYFVHWNRGANEKNCIGSMCMRIVIRMHIGSPLHKLSVYLSAFQTFLVIMDRTFPFKNTNAGYALYYIYNVASIHLSRFLIYHSLLYPIHHLCALCRHTLSSIRSLSGSLFTPLAVLSHIEIDKMKIKRSTHSTV